jgi:hypothetical protein
MSYLSAIYKSLESLQYGFLYLVAAFLGGIGLDFTFPRYTKDRETGRLIGEIIGQCLALVLVVILIRHIIQNIPLLFPILGSGHRYMPYGTNEFNGEMMMGLVFLSSQLNLLAKIDDLAKRIYFAVFNEEKVVEHKFFGKAG